MEQMTKEEEKQYWRRVIGDVQRAGYTLAELAKMLQVEVRLVTSWREGHRPTGLLAVRLYELRRTIVMAELTITSPSATGVARLM